MKLRERTESMRMRVLDRVAAEPWNRSDVQHLDSALTAALAHRDALLDDDHDIDLLHPARVVLILLDDARINDASVLATAALLESERIELAAKTIQDGSLRDAVNSIPTPLSCASDLLAESLLTLPPTLLTAAVAERLDQARHLHLRPVDQWQSGLALEEAVYLPLSVRAGDALARRYQRWHLAFRRRVDRLPG